MGDLVVVAPPRKTVEEVMLSKRDAERRLFGDVLDAELRDRGLRKVPCMMGGE